MQIKNELFLWKKEKTHIKILTKSKNSKYINIIKRLNLIQSVSFVKQNINQTNISDII